MVLDFIKWALRNVVHQRQTVFIFGCQRSGTTVASDVLGSLHGAFSYPETNSELTDQDQCELPHYTIRLNPLNDVKRKIDSNRHNLIIVKPLVESQRAAEILDFFPNARALWLYRNYRDVVNSMCEKWGTETGRPHLSPIIAGDPSNWRSEQLASDVRDIILTSHSRGISGPEGWGLHWYARNSTYFSQSLDKDERCLLIKYETLVQGSGYLCSAFKKLGIEIDVAKLNSVWNLHAHSVEKGSNIKMSGRVDRLLHAMQVRLDAAEEAQELSLS